MSVLEQQMAERRNRILESARMLIEGDGYDRLTMRDLAEASEVTVPTIYNLIGNKAQVLLAAVEDQTQAFVSALDRAHGDLLGVVEATVRELVRRPRYYRSLLHVLGSSRQADPARRYAWHALASQIDRALAEIDEAGELASWVDRTVLAERLHAHIDSVSIDWARGALTSAGFRSAALLDASIMMLGVTSGATRERFERAARDNQRVTSRSRAPRARSGRAA